MLQSHHHLEFEMRKVSGDEPYLKDCLQTVCMHKLQAKEFQIAGLAKIKNYNYRKASAEQDGE